MGLYTDRLKRLDGSMKQQMKDYTPGGFSLPPEGEYNGRISVTLDETNAEPKRLMAVWLLAIAEGEQEGRKITDRTILEDNKVGAQICRGRIEDLGYEWPEKLVDLEEVLDAINEQAPMVTFQLTHETSTGKEGTKNVGKSFTNPRIRITDVIGDGEETSTEETEETGDTEGGEEPSVDSSDDDIRDQLLALCGSYGLDTITDEMDVTSIVEALNADGVKFKETDLQPEELALLEGVDAELVEREEVEPPKRTVTKPAPKQAPKKVAPVTKKVVKKAGRR